MNDSVLGMEYKVVKEVRDEDLAINVKSGSIEVFSTPMLVALIEQAASELSDNILSESDTTVGVKVCIDHKAPTIIGEEVTAKAKIISVEGKKITFKVSACDRFGEISSGIHERVIVNKAKFIENALKRANKNL